MQQVTVVTLQDLSIIAQATSQKDDQVSNLNTQNQGSGYSPKSARVQEAFGQLSGTFCNMWCDPSSHRKLHTSGFLTGLQENLDYFGFLVTLSDLGNSDLTDMVADPGHIRVHLSFKKV
ncbi:hypothetical protein WISP_115737 [Willisornis vidua]|uniref:Uncharacterized protein n=1 Tax=Willisornis vidua TaxID=1566151 RepID=A0ABQ9CU28_9PASS|nr:hypothetical protein WISP_115737 [Willisornis vidua]